MKTILTIECDNDLQHHAEAILKERIDGLACEMKITKVVTLYKFSELSEEIQRKTLSPFINTLNMTKEKAIELLSPAYYLFDIDGHFI